MDEEFDCAVLLNVNNGAETSLIIDSIDPDIRFLDISVRNELLGSLSNDFPGGFDPEDAYDQEAMNKWEDFYRWLGDKISLLKNNPGEDVLDVEEVEDIWLRLTDDRITRINVE